MFGDPALKLLNMIGHSGTVPGALLAKEIPTALARLEQALNAVSPDEGEMHSTPAAGDPDAAPPVGLRLRAHPLIQLLTASAQSGCDVTWSEDYPLV